MNSSCRAARRDLSDRLDGAPIPYWRRFWGTLHLSVCPLCKRVRRSLHATRDALAALKDVDPTE